MKRDKKIVSADSFFLIYEKLYLCYFALLMAMAFKDTTMIPYQWPVKLRYLLLISGILLVGSGFILRRNWTMAEVAAAAVLCIAFVGSWYRCQRPYILELVILLIGANGVSFKKILKVYLGVSLAGMVLMVTLAMTGKIENLVYVQEIHNNILRYAFGSIYPTDFSAHVFFIIMAYAWVRGKNLTYPEAIVFAGAGLFCYRFCGARVSTICILTLSAVIVLFRIFKGDISNYRFLKAICYFGGKAAAAGPVLCTAVMLGLTLGYTPNVSWISRLNLLLSYRLKLGKIGFSRYPVKWFGQYVELIGNGGSVEEKKGYFFLDSSYINILICMGILSLAGVLLIHTVLLIRQNQEQNFMTVMVLCLVLVQCMMEHHMIEIAYNPFLLAFFTEAGMKGMKGTELTVWRKKNEG